MNVIFIGQSDLGETRITAYQLKKLIFKEPPVLNKITRKTSFPGTLVLNNEFKISVTNLERRSWHYSSLWVPPKKVFSGFHDLRFVRGETESTVHFDKIRKMKFTPDNGVELLLKNGNVVTGKIDEIEYMEILGFNGTYEENEIFVSTGNVKEIEFGN